MKHFTITLTFLFIISAYTAFTQKFISSGTLDNSEAQLEYGNIQKLNQDVYNPDVPHKFKIFNDCQFLKREDYKLPENYTSNLIQLEDGQTYTGSTNGIILWDNYYIITITTENSNIPENNITALALDQDDQLWIGTKSSGIVIGIGKAVKPFKIIHVQTHHQNIKSIYADEVGLVWVAYKNGSIESFLNGNSCSYFPSQPVDELLPSTNDRF